MFFQQYNSWDLGFSFLVCFVRHGICLSHLLSAYICMSTRKWINLSLCPLYSVLTPSKAADAIFHGGKSRFALGSKAHNAR